MKTKKLLLMPIALITMCLLMTGCDIPGVNTNTGTDSPLTTDVTTISNFTVKREASGTDTNGYAYQEYSYTVYPEAATNLGVNASISFADDRADGASYLGATVNTTAQNFRITCYAAFDSVATVRIQATSGDAYADIVVNYRQKLATAGFDNSYTCNVGTETSLLWTNFSNGHYQLTGNSVYTIAETFTYTGLKQATLAAYSASSTLMVPYITQDSNYEGTVQDINLLLHTAVSNWLPWAKRDSGGSQSERDLFIYMEDALSQMTDNQKAVLATADSNDTIKITIPFASIESYYSTSQSTDLSYTVTGRYISFLLPSTIYHDYGVSRNIISLTPESNSIEF